jgi:hypothetical protein
MGTYPHTQVPHPGVTMNVFCELMTPTKSEPHRCYRWEPAHDSMWRVGVLTIEGDRTTTTYEVDETAADVGRAFTLRKPAGGFYCVDVRGFAADRCDCYDFENGRGKLCKHLEALRSLIDNDQL